MLLIFEQSYDISTLTLEIYNLKILKKWLLSERKKKKTLEHEMVKGNRYLIFN